MKIAVDAMGGYYAPEAIVKGVMLAREKFNDIELRVSQKHIASYLGITPESLSRIKKKTYNK